MNQKSEIWIKKYLPKKTSEVIGQQKQIEKIKKYVENYKKGNKAIFLYGGQGNGKTSSIYALAEEDNYELIELNASDTRNKEAIETILGGASKQMSLFGTNKLILVDEIEGISGMKDRGAIQNIIKIVKESNFPIVIIGHDAHHDKVKALKKESELIEYTQLTPEETMQILNTICKIEKIECEEKTLKQLARISGGDARAAINDLQTISAGKQKIEMKDIEEISDRQSTQKIEEALKIIFKTTNPEIALNAYNNVAEDLDKIFLWVEENIPKEYMDPKTMNNAFDALSLADVFYGRIRRWQYYRFYVYCYQLLSVGIALSKKEKNTKETQYKTTSRLLKIWIYNNANAKKKGIAQKIAQKTHTSQKEAFHNTVPFIQAIFKKNKEETNKISKYLDLTDEEIVWLKTK
ncbi:replication factor C large subunit [Candidatus Woesearchaeota archaeon]|nr:replication factor C large subunit [Candidatus Woesearchaeota archaeon]MCF7900652.1 replication factor C large subunit [Candidatus Woesearchaeota archaeon]MCF8013513.1 replication factor C large subunit [Candidatus Woesearchaeota archaeon]